MALPLPSWRGCPSLYICLVVFLHRFLAISAIFRHTYVDITPTEGLSVPAYQRHELICKASFRGEAPEIEWFKAPGRIRLDNNPRFAVKTTYNSYDTVVSSRLIFKNALPGDSGTYLCEIVSGGAGVSQVQVKFWSEPVLTPDPDKTIIPGDEHMLTCSMQGGFDGSMLWSKDGMFIGIEGNFDTDGDHVPDVRILPQSHSLVILNAGAYDAGVYSCRFRYNYGRQWKSLAGNINVYAGVELRSDSYVLWQGNQTSPLRVQCTATGYPLPMVSWSYTTKKIDVRTGSWNNTIAIYDNMVSQVLTQSTMTIARMPGFFNITKFYCKGENRISSKSNTIMIVNVGKRSPPTLGPTTDPLPYTVALHLVEDGPAWTRLIPGRAASTSSCNVMLLTLAICTSELLRRNMR